MPRPVVTPDLLLAAWRRRRRSDWPATFEDTMSDPMLSRLVRAEAVGIALAALKPGSQRPAPRPLVHTTPLAAPATRGIDRKRAASGDRDD